MDLQQLTVGGLNFAYRWDGRPETDADAPVVMMAHAMGTSLRIWDLQVAALADRYRVLRYDWRGHGHSAAPPGPYSLAEFEADAVGVMDALGLPQVHWVGISTGGMILFDTRDGDRAVRYAWHGTGMSVSLLLPPSGQLKIANS